MTTKQRHHHLFATARPGPAPAAWHPVYVLAESPLLAALGDTHAVQKLCAGIAGYWLAHRATGRLSEDTVFYEVLYGDGVGLCLLAAYGVLGVECNSGKLSMFEKSFRCEKSEIILCDLHYFRRRDATYFCVTVYG